MDYFGQAAEIDQLRKAINNDGPLATLAAHAKLAWYLRQRDTVLAREHVCSAQLAIEQFRAKGRRAIRSLSARLTLVEAEAKWLFCEPGADAAANDAYDQFVNCCDDIGQGDALVLQAQINYDNADSSVRARLWERAAQIYRAAGDIDRAELVAAWQGYDATFLDAQAIEAAVIDLKRLQQARHPGVQAIAMWSLAAVHYDRSEMAAAIRGYRAALELMDQTGQLRSAISLMHNTGTAFDNLYDYASALTWFEDASERARRTGWPRSEGSCLMGVGDVLRQMGRHDAALEFLLQAQLKMKPVPAGRHQATLQNYIGDAYVALNNPREALRCFNEAESMLRNLNSTSQLCYGLRGKALAFSQNEQATQAVATASEALNIAKTLGDRSSEIEILCVLASIARKHNLPAPRRSKAATAAIHYLQRAIRLAKKLEGHVMPADVFAGLSRDHEQTGDMTAALKAERDAAVARNLTYTKEAAQSAVAMQVRFDTDIARADAQHQRALAQSEAQRVAELNVANDLLAKVSQVGQAITRCLSSEALMYVLLARTRDLLPAHSVSVWLLKHGVIEALPAPGEQASQRRARRLNLDSASPVVRCVTDQQAERIDRAEDAEGSMRSALLIPLSNGHTVQGALAIETTSAHAYGERDMHVATSLASYVTIAMANALAHEELEQSARTDKLTSIANRRSFDEILTAEIRRSSRSARPLSLVLIDVDYFKLYNDKYGHSQGDECLRQIAACLAGFCRAGSDLAARYGGEEFALVLPETDRDEALTIAERFRVQVAALRIPHVASHVCDHVTISAGVSTLLGSQATDPKEWIESADLALYAAKRSGRNRCHTVLGSQAATSATSQPSAAQA